MSIFREYFRSDGDYWENICIYHQVALNSLYINNKYARQADH